MSDSDCSNCDKECPRREDSYNCWFLERRDLKEIFSPEETHLLEEALMPLERRWEETGNDDLAALRHPLADIVEKLKDTSQPP